MNDTFLFLYPDCTTPDTALHKGGDETNIDNYRPISVLCAASKLMERHVYKSLYAYLNDNQLLSPSQSGFRAGYSTQTSLVKMINYWLSAVNSGEIVSCITLDMRKAFDVLHHDLLLQKLAAYGCSPETVLWFSSYLKGRKQTVVLGDKISSSSSLEYGVPQGSILGPLIFNIFVNDSANVLTFSILDMYADDMTLYVTGKSVSEVQSKLEKDLYQIVKWCDRNGLIINIDKSKCLIICTSQKRRHLDISKLYLNVKGITLECVNEIKILGLTIDHNLTWHAHINTVCTKMSRMIGILWRIRDLLSQSMKQMFYNAYILPSLDYALIAWSGLSDGDLNRILLLQKRAVRVVTDSKWDAPSKPLFRRLGWMTIKQRVEYQRSVLMYKCLSGLAPNYLSDLFQYTEPNHQYALRSINNILQLIVPKAKTEQFKSSFSYAGASTWNKLPSTIKCVSSLESFKLFYQRNIFYHFRF